MIKTFSSTFASNKVLRLCDTDIGMDCLDNISRYLDEYIIRGVGLSMTDDCLEYYFCQAEE